jgi:hypothetical protein
MLTVKQLVLQAVSELPDDADIDDVLDRILFVHKVQRGIEQLDAGQTHTIDEVRQRMAKWLR